MATLQSPFNAGQFRPSTVGAGSLPVGEHKVVITSSELKGTKNNNQNGMLVLNLEIIEGEHAGATGFYQLNLYHQSEQTARIAHEQLSAVCHVTGQMQIQDSTQLHNIPFIAVVRLQKGEEAREKNWTEVAGVKDINGNNPGQQGAQGGGQPQQQPTQQQPQSQPQPQQPAAGGWGQPQQGQPQAAPQQAPAQGGGAAPWQQPQGGQQPAPGGWGQTN